MLCVCKRNVSGRPFILLRIKTQSLNNQIIIIPICPKNSNQRVLRTKGIRIIEFLLSKDTKPSRPEGLFTGGGGGGTESRKLEPRRAGGGMRGGLNHTLIGGGPGDLPRFF